MEYTYEVQWKNGPGGKKYANSFEPPECLVGWEAEMKKVDEQVLLRSQQIFLNPTKVARQVQEAKAREKAEELSQRRDSMLRKQRRLSRAAFSDGEAEDDDELQPESGDELLPDGEQLDRELIAVMEDLQALRPPAAHRRQHADCDGDSDSNGRGDRDRGGGVRRIDGRPQTQGNLSRLVGIRPQHQPLLPPAPAR